MLIDLAIQYRKPEDKFIDLGTGTGCIGITLSKLFHYQGILVDNYDQTIKVTKHNILKHQVNLSIIKTDWLKCLEQINTQEYNVLLTNPPYLTTSEVNMFTNLKYDPIQALVGSVEQYYLPIAKVQHMFRLIIMEIHPAFTKQLLELFTTSKIYKDLNRMNRFLVVE